MALTILMDKTTHPKKEGSYINLEIKEQVKSYNLFNDRRAKYFLKDAPELIEETRIKSLEECKSEATLEMVKNLLNLNVSLDIIEKSSNISKDEILKIKETLLN